MAEEKKKHGRAPSNLQDQLSNFVFKNRVAGPAGAVTDAQVFENVQKLGNLAQHRRAAKKIAKNKDTIRGLLDSVRQKPRFPKMIEYAVECLTRLAVDEVSVEELVDEGVLEMMKHVLSVHPYNEEIQRMVNKALQRMCVNPRMTALVAETFGSSPLLFSLNRHVEADTQITTCHALASMMKDKAALDRFVNDGVIEAIAAMLKKNEDNVDILAAAAKALSAIADDPQYADRLLASGVLETLVHALGNNPNAVELAKHAIAIFGKVAKHSPACLKALREMNVVDAIVNALDANPQLKDLLAIGATALASLSDKSDVGSAMSIVKTGDLTESHASALATVGSLALVEDNVAYIVETGGIPAIIGTLQTASGKHDDLSYKILETGCRALERCAVNEANIYEIMKAGGVKLMMSILQSAKDNEKVVAAALGAIAAMCTRQENTNYIAKVQGAATAIAAHYQHPNSALVARQVVSVLAALAAHEETVGLVVQQGGIEGLLSIIKHHASDPEIVAAAINALGRLAVSAENIERIKQAGGFQLLVDALNAHATNPELCLQAMLMLETAALIPENIDTLRAIGALDAVMKAMETHPDNPEIQEVGARTLGLFATKEQLVAVLNNFNALVDQLARSNQVTAPGIMARMIPALGMLSNLALIPANLVIFTQNNAIQSLVRAYEVATKQPQSAERDKLVQLITKTIARMCGDEQNASYMLSSGAYSKMLDAVILQPDNTALAEITIEVGVAIAAHTALAGQMMALVEKVVTVADVHSLSAKVLAGATKLLGYLATNDTSAGQIVQQNGGVVIAESVLNSLPTPEDLLTALAVLSSLAVDEAAVEALIAAGGLDSIIDAMKAHPDKPAILIAAMKALGRLAINEKIAKLIGEKGALALVTQAMRDHHVHEELIEVAVVLLDSLALVPYNAKILLDDCNADELLRWAMASYPDNATIQEAAARCLAVLAAAAAAVPAAFASLDAEALIALLLDPSLTPEQALAALKRVQELLDAEDPTAAQLFLAKGGLQALGALATRFVDNDAVMKACAAAFQTISRRADKLLTKEQLSSMEAPAALEALLRILHPRAGVLSSLDSDQLLAAVSLLGDLASRKENVAAIIKQGGVGELLKMLNSDDPRVLEAAARVLAKISNDEEGARLLAQTATIKELIAAMRKHKDKPDFLRHAVYLLGNLALNELLKTQIGSFGGIQVIIETMELHPFVAPLIENCNYTLANLSFNNEMNMGLIVACNGIFHIIQSMINHSTAEDLLDSAMCCLSNLCYKSDANKEMIVKSGGAKAIVDSLLANFNNGNLVISGFRALGNLAFYPPNVSPIIREGGVQSIVAGITVHARNQAVVQIAVGVMTNLAADLSPENMAIMTQEGAVQAIVEVVSNYRDNVEVEIGALTCLINLSRDSMNAGMVAKQGGVIAIVQVMRTLTFDTIVMTKAVALIGMLSVTPANVPRIIQDQGAAALVEALSSEYDSGALEMAAEALRALFSMGCTEEYCTMLGRQGVIQAVMKVTAKHADNPAMLIECLRTLGGLSRSESNASAMALPSMKCIETSLSVHSREHNLILFAMSFLANLCVYASAAEMVTSTSLVNKVIASLRVYLDNVEVALRCLRALENMALASNNVKIHMKEVDAVPSLKMAHDSALNADVKKAIQMVIDTIERAKLPAKEEKSGLKSAKAIFGDEEDKKPEFDEDSVVLPEDVRNFLTAGALLIKHSKTAKPKPRHVFVTSDLKTLVWKDVRDSKDEKAPPSMKAIKIRTVERGRCTPQLQRKQWGKFLAKEECSFAVIGRERTVDLEAPNATEREKWARMLLTWLDYHKARKRAAARF